LFCVSGGAEPENDFLILILIFSEIAQESKGGSAVNCTQKPALNQIIIL
jgi:hypothetical protein